jgi:hypothetical protein
MKKILILLLVMSASVSAIYANGQGRGAGNGTGRGNAVENDVPGQYANPQLQKLYDDLTAQGKKSLSDALIAGATVEDLDIYDLQRLINEAENEEVKVLYQNLMKGSRNHMRSFTAQLERQGFTYEASYISDEYLERILKINREMAPIADPDYLF